MDVGDLVIPPGQGAVWQMAPGRSAALKITSEMTQSVMMFEEVAPTDTVTDLHVHHDSDEIAYVLSGEVTFKIGDQVTVGGPGTCAFMPRGSFFEEAVQNNRPISTMSGQEVAEAFQRHRWEVIGPPPF